MKRVTAADNNAKPQLNQSTVPAVGRVVLREQVKQWLLQRILSGYYAPGERLVETKIAQELGISQSPVREALRDLQLLRFVESASFRGSWVREVGNEELIEIYPVRAALEEVAARVAATRLGGDVASLDRQIDAMAKAEDLPTQVGHDVQFHRLIVEASGNTRLLEVWSSLQVEAHTLISALRTGLDHNEIAEMHRPIVEALRARDGIEAGLEIRRHIETFGQLLQKGIASSPD
ncbi:MAG: GntR family transcriptional regulator [Gemmatimonadaceae bacterium]